jgi:hypothetical protein
MSRRTAFTALFLPLLLGGCAALRPAPPPDQDAQLQLHRGLEALHQGQYAGAYDRLAWVVTHCPAQEAGLHAQAGLAALELDPNNPVGRPATGMRILADLILGPATPSHLRVLAETTYILSLGLGAPPATVPGQVDDPDADTPTDQPRDPTPPAAAPRPGAWTRGATAAADPGLARPRPSPVHGCGPVLAAAESVRTSLPTLPGPSLAAMLSQAEARQRAAVADAEGLRGEVARLRQELEATAAELARIRRTLRP